MTTRYEETHMTLQEMFDKTYRHFVYEGGKPSYYLEPSGRGCAGPSIVCCCHGPGGERCPIGLCIPNDKYLPSMEGRVGLRITKIFPDIPAMALSRLQECHDDACYDEQATAGAFLGGVKRRLEAFAENYGLKIPEASEAVTC